MAGRWSGRLEKGVELFNRHQFYEAHEVWEEAWQEDASDDRLFLQGLIQVAAGFYKLQTGSPVGAVKLLEQGALKLKRFADRPMGVDLPPLLRSVEEWRAAAERLVAERRCEYDPARFPKIRLVGPAG